MKRFKLIGLFVSMVFIFMLALSLPIFGYAATIRVPEDYPTIQAGINAAVNGDTVLVNNGTYYENIDFLGKAITVTTVNGPFSTIIDGSGNISPAVTFKNGEGLNSIIDGFTITRGPAVWTDAWSGVYCFSSFPTIKNNRIIDNRGTGIYVTDYSFAVIQNNTILGNGGIGIYSHNFSNPTIQNNLIVGNLGDGVYARDYATVTVKNNTIIYNLDDGIGVGFLSTPFTIENNIIALNAGYGFGREWAVPPPNLSHNDVWGNAQGDYNGFTPGPGDISADPLFEGLTVNVPIDYPTITKALDRIGKFYLGQGSPCIGADSNGKNMGAYPNQSNYLVPGDRVVNVASGTYYESLLLPPSAKLIGAGSAGTILDAQGKSDVVRLYGGVAQDVIDGFTIRNGLDGIYCYGSSVLIQNNIITNNQYNGVGCYDFYSGYSSFPIIQNNTIEKNGEDGIECSASSPTIQNNIIRDNGFFGISSGVGIESRNSFSTIQNNTISNNKYEGIISSSSGGFTQSSLIDNNVITGNGWYGIECDASSPTIQNNTILGNEKSGVYLGAFSSTSNSLTQNNVIIGNGEEGIRTSGGSAPVIINNTISGNGNSGVYSKENSTPTIQNNIITSNRDYGVYVIDSAQPVISFNDVWDNAQGDYSGVGSGPGDISSDPLFEGLRFNVPIDYPTITQALDRIAKFYLGQGSPCIGADSNGKNMGAYPNQSSYLTPGDHEVYVVSGTYYEALVLPPFTKLIGLCGGAVVLDAQGKNSVIRSFGGSDQNIIRGFTIQNGKKGIHCSGSSPIIERNVITTNTEEGINCNYSSPLIKNNTISFNVLEGILYRNSSSTILNNIITSNNASGIKSSNSTLTIQNNIISGSIGYAISHGIDAWDSSLLVQNNTIVGNEGSGVANVSYFAPSSATIVNNIVASNGLYGIWVYGFYPNISYNDVWNNSAGNYYQNAYAGLGDVSIDPLFIDPTNKDFHLTRLSPCIDVGSPNISGLPPFDFEGDKRVLDGNNNGQAIVDMGADEFRKGPPLIKPFRICP